MAGRAQIDMNRRAATQLTDKMWEVISVRYKKKKLLFTIAYNLVCSWCNSMQMVYKSSF